MADYLRFEKLWIVWASKATWVFLWAHRWHFFWTASLPFGFVLLYDIAEPFTDLVAWNDVVMQIIVAATGVAIWAFVGVISFVRNFMIAPSRIYHSKVAKMERQMKLTEERSEKALERIQVLEQERIPKIVALPKVGTRHLGIGPYLMWAELEVENTSLTKVLKDTQVRIVTTDAITPDQDKPCVYKNLGDFIGDWSPITLRWMQSDLEAVNIPGGSSRTALIAFSNDSNGPPAVFNDRAQTRCSLELKITVEISSPDTATFRSAYFIECQGSMVRRDEELQWVEAAHFEFVPWDEWASTRTVIASEAAELAPDTEDSQP